MRPTELCDEAGRTFTSERHRDQSPQVEELDELFFCRSGLSSTVRRGHADFNHRVLAYRDNRCARLAGQNVCKRVKELRSDRLRRL